MLGRWESCADHENYYIKNPTNTGIQPTTVEIPWGNMEK